MRRRRPRPSAPAVQEAVRLVQSGEARTIDEAAAMTGANRKTVGGACRKAGVRSSFGARRRDSSIKRASAVDLVKSGMTITAVANALGVSRPVVSDACARDGVLIRRRGHSPKIDRAALRSAWHLVIRGELSTADLARRWGVSRSAIRQAAKDLDLPALGFSRSLAAKG